MPLDSQIHELLSVWEQRRAQAQPISPEDLCHNRPELLDEFRKQIQRLESAERLLETASDAAPVGSTPESDSKTRRFRCPHCHNPLHLADDSSDEVLCPACGSSFRVRDTRATSTSSGMQQLGKFQLLERVGTGGFGAVWRARDTELNRIVALKMLHAGHLGAPADQERFYREARAAAHLRHASIVTVHEVVELNGSPVIVSDFIDGLTLRDFMKTRPLTFREAAELTVQIAQALHYAHEKGVVHRDIKPSNIMVEFPANHETSKSVARGAANSRPSPRPLIMDLGLALREDVEITVTLDGQIIGTPAYMSPEQAKGEGHRVDRRSDVYSLGVVYYELLTGELPFRGNKAMIVHQVLREEPRPPRKLIDKMPRDLETICLKCLQKEPGRRYDSAQALAEDLQRFLDGEAIRARPTSWWERSGRWVRRRPAVAALLTALVGLTVFTFVSVTMSWRDAEDARTKALGQKENAERQEGIAREHQQRAEASFRLARDTWEAAATKLTSDPRLNNGELEDLRRVVLEAEQTFYEKFVELRGDEPVFQLERGKAYLRLGILTQQIATKQQAIPHFEKAHEIFADLFRDHPSVVDYQDHLAGAKQNLSVMYSELGRRQDAEQTLLGSLAIRRALVRDHGSVDRYRHALAVTCNTLAVYFRRNNQPREAEEAYLEAAAIMKALVRDHAKVEYEASLGMIQNNFGLFCEKLGRFPEAEHALQESLVVRKRLAVAHPKNHRHQDDLAATYTNLGILYRRMREPVKAEQTYQNALLIQQKLAQDHPSVSLYTMALGGLQMNLGNLVRDAERFADAIAWYDQGIESLQAFHAKEPKDVAGRRALFNAHWGRAIALTGVARHQDALKDADRAITYDIDQMGPRLGSQLRMQRALSLAHLKRHLQSAVEVERALALRDPADISTLYHAACIYGISFGTTAADPKLAEQYASRAIALLRQVVAKGYTDLPMLRLDAELEAFRSHPEVQKLLKSLEKSK